MADDDSRRGVTAMADADTTEQIINSTENPQTAEEHPNPSEGEAVATQPTEELAQEKNTLPSEQDAQKNTTELIPTASRDSEETRNLLAKAREELNKAREESARARDEVERAKKDLAVAKQDPSTANQAVTEVKKLVVEENPSLSEPTPKDEMVDKVPGISEALAAVAAQVDNSTTQPEKPKEVNPVKDGSENSNQNCEAIPGNTEDVEDQPVITSESQLELECKPAVGRSEAGPNVDSLKASIEDQFESSKDHPDKHIEPLDQIIEKVKNESHIEEGQLVEGGHNPGEEKDEKAELVEGVKEEDEVVEDEVVEDEEEEGEVVKVEHEEDELIEGEHEEDEAVEGEEDETVEGEREEGDGEESDEEGAPAKPLDDDEDRRNPQYIPKRGGFYEHDDRNREEVEEAAPEEPAGVEEKPKKTRSEAIDRWGHDMFDPNQQGPKTGDELVDAYGYDIRQEEGAPRARRRRRYGRGPNKYDRTWEDEDAYSRPRGRGGAATRGGPSERGSGFDRNSEARAPRPQRQEMPKKDEFPALSDHRQEPRAQGETAPKPSSQSNWREGERGVAMTGGNERRGGGNSNNSKANAISFRRGGGGRTFEERRESKESKAVKSRGENSSQPGELDEQNVGEQPLRENFRSPRKAVGEASTRGASSPRGGSSRGFGNRGGGAATHASSSRGGGPDAAPRGRGAPNARGRRNDNPNWDRGEGGNNRGGASHQPFSRGQRASQDVRMDHRGPYEEPRGRGRGKVGRPLEGNAEQAVVGGMEQMRIEDHTAPSRNQDVGRSKRYSSQRQRMTTPPPANTGAPVIQQPSYPVAAGGNTAYYASYNDSPPPNYVAAAPAPLLPMAVAAQGAPPSFISQTMYPAGPGPAPFNAGPYQGYPPAPAPPAVPVGVPIGSPTQDYMYGGGTMYYDPGRQPIRHGTQPTRRAKAAIPIVAPDNEVDSYLISGRRLNHE